MYQFPKPSSNEPEPCGSSGKLHLCRNELLGKGSMGTRVYKGYFEETQPVAIKQILRDQVYGIDPKLFDTVQQSNEAKLLRKFNHPNVVRYYLADATPDFVIIALELCDGCLVNYIEKTPDAKTFAQLYANESSRCFKKAIINDVLQGLDYLHDQDIIHGDIKPQNILLRRVKKRVNLVQGLNFEGVLTDFGLSLEIDENRKSKTAHENLIGSDGWRPKEILVTLEKSKEKSTKKNANHKVKGTKAVDIFAFGCVIQYVMTEKSIEYHMHPFGNSNFRDQNIKAEERRTYTSLSKYRKSKPNQDDVLADMLIEICTIGNPELRPTTKEIAKNPFFWNAETIIQFLERVFNDIKLSKEGDVTDFTKGLEEKWSVYHNWKFIKEIPEAFDYDNKHRSNSKRSSINAQKLYHLLRLFRNIRQHYQEIIANQEEPSCVALSICLGKGEDEDFAKYFFHKIVAVLPVVYLSLVNHPRHANYSSYYPMDEISGGSFAERVQIQWALLDKVLVRHDNEKAGPSGRARSRTPSSNSGGSRK